MEHSIDYTMDTFFGKLAMSPESFDQNDALSVFSYVKFLERKASILEDIVNTSHTIAEINQTLQSNPNLSCNETLTTKSREIGTQTDTVVECDEQEAPQPTPINKIDSTVLRDSLLVPGLEITSSDPHEPEENHVFSPTSLSTISSLTISEIGKSTIDSPFSPSSLSSVSISTIDSPIRPFEMIKGNPFEKFCTDIFLRELDFSHKFTNRRSVYFGEFDYEYSGGKHKARDIPPNSYLASICSYLEVLFPDFPYNSALINFYGNGADYLPAHSDNEECIDEDSYILTVSLGSTRTMRFTDISSKSAVADIDLKHGDVMVMSKESQMIYQHELLPSSVDAGSRISITFRLINRPTCQTSTPTDEEVDQDPLDINSNENCGYVPYKMHDPFPVRNRSPIYHQMRNQHTNPSVSNHNKSPRTRVTPPKNSNHKQDTLYISSSLFRHLNERKMSSIKHSAKVLFHPGANSHQMLTRMLQDNEFLSLDKAAIKQIFILTGTNYVDSLSSHTLNYDTAVRGINEICFKLWDIFVNAKINVVNILPRADRLKNNVVNELNRSIREMCRLHGLNFVDTESKNRLFSESSGNRKQQFFNDGYFDDVHLNVNGISRLSRHLKYLAHIL